MEKQEMQVIISAKKLMLHTIKLTSNINHYPKKYRHSIVDRMQIKSMDIYETLMEANRTDLKDYKRERQEMQTKAITYCDELLTYIEISQELNFISQGSMEHWSKMVLDVKRLSLAWRSKDKER